MIQKCCTEKTNHILFICLFVFSFVYAFVRSSVCSFIRTTERNYQKKIQKKTSLQRKKLEKKNTKNTIFYLLLFFQKNHKYLIINTFYVIEFLLFFTFVKILKLFLTFITSQILKPTFLLRALTFGHHHMYFFDVVVFLCICERVRLCALWLFCVLSRP